MDDCFESLINNNFESLNFCKKITENDGCKEK